MLEQVVGQVLRHLLRQRRDQRALLDLDPLADLVHQVVDLVARLAHVDLGVDDPGRPHELLDDAAEWLRSKSPGVADTKTICGALGGTRRTSADGCRARSGAGSRSRRASACASGRPRTCRRSAARSVRLVDEADEVVGEVVDQAVRALARLAAVEDARVVLDPVAEPELAQHLHVELGALPQAVRLQQLALLVEHWCAPRARRGSRPARARSSWVGRVVGRRPDPTSSSPRAARR